MSRTIFQKITSSLWVLVSFVPFFNGLGFVYIGNKYANANWFAEGILYEVPLILGVLTLPNIAVSTVFFTIGTLASFVSIIRSIMVDFNLQKQLDQSAVIDKPFEEKLNDAINSLWVLISFVPFLNGVGLMYKGHATPKKSWLIEGLIYQMSWVIGLLALGIQSVRFIAFEVAFVLYFVSIIRSVMIATEPQPLYARTTQKVEFKAKASKEEKAKGKGLGIFDGKAKEKEPKVNEEKFDVNIKEGVIPAFKFYEKQFNELEEIFPQKEKNAMELIEKRFAPPQLTYSRFKRVVDESHETFYSQLHAGKKILELSTEYSTKVEDELKNKVLVLNSIIQSLDKLSEELVLNITQVESESDNEINDLFEEFSRVTRSVQAYE